MYRLQDGRCPRACQAARRWQPWVGSGSEYEKQLAAAMARLESLTVVKDAKIQKQHSRVLQGT